MQPPVREQCCSISFPRMFCTRAEIPTLPDGGEPIDSNLYGRFRILKLRRNRICKEIGSSQNKTFQIDKIIAFKKSRLRIMLKSISKSTKIGYLRIIFKCIRFTTHILSARQLTPHYVCPTTELHHTCLFANTRFGLHRVRLIAKALLTEHIL